MDEAIIFEQDPVERGSVVEEGGEDGVAKSCGSVFDGEGGIDTEGEPLFADDAGIFDGCPSGIDGGTEDPEFGVGACAGEREHIEGSFGHVGVWMAGAFVGGAEGVFEVAELAFCGGHIDDKAHWVGCFEHQGAQVAHQQKGGHRIDRMNLEKLEGMDLIDLHFPACVIAHIGVFAITVVLVVGKFCGCGVQIVWKKRHS